MDDFLELANKALSMWQLHPIAFSAGGLILNQFVRVGPGRALSLALRSRLFRRPYPFTARTEELQELQELLTTKSSGQYIVVMGPKGVGKTVLVRSATATCGVVDVEVGGGASDEKILRDAYSAIVKPPFKLDILDPAPSALRVLRFYKLFSAFSRQSPTIVFHLKERPQNKGEFAAITGAVRTLSDQGFRVIVDSSTHAAPIDLLRTKREIVFEVDFMTRSVVERITEYKALFDTLKKYRLDSLVWEVVGGDAAILTALCVATKRSDPEQQIYKVLREHIRRAENDCNRLLNIHADAAKVFEHFRAADSLPFRKGAPWMETDVNVFRLKKNSYFVPKTPAHALVLRHQTDGRTLSESPLEELRNLCPSQTEKETIIE
jgi:hypothetical protein